MAVRKESVPVALARESISYYLQNKKMLSLPDNLPAELSGKRAGVFVSLKKEGKLRGCIGTIFPTKDNIALEIIGNAVSAAIHDNRFYPVNLDEIDSLSISVDILSAPEKINNISQLDPKIYGVIVSYGFKKGLLLPNLDGIDSVEEQIDIARQKAGIFPGEDYTIERFSVKRFI